MKNVALILCGLVLLANTFTNAYGQNDDRPIGINLSYIADHSPQRVFVDGMKQARRWIVQDAAGDEWSISGIDVPSRDDLYPTHVPFEVDGEQYRVHTLLYRELEHGYPAGDYTVIFEGTGEIIFGFDAGYEVFTESDVAHQLTIDNPGQEGIWLIIDESDVNDPIHNIRVIAPGYADSYQSNPFHPRLIELLEPFSVVRYMMPQETLNASIESWSNRTRVDTYTQYRSEEMGMAPEYIAMLSNISETDPWINIPERANDEFVRNFAQVMLDSLDDDRTLYVEYSNETWNNIYTAYQYMIDQGVSSGLHSDDQMAGTYFYVQRSMEIYEIFDEVFAQSPITIYKMLAPFSFDIDNGRDMIEALDDPELNPTDQTIDALAVAPYFGGEIPDMIPEEGMVESISIEAIVDSIGAHNSRETLQVTLPYRELADSLELDLITYEGGLHLRNFNSTHRENATLQQKLHEAARHPDMEQIFDDHFDMWYENGGDLYVLFNLIDADSKWGRFGTFTHMQQDTSTSHRWRSLRNTVFSEDVATRLESSRAAPQRFSLKPNYPNPFNPSTTIPFTLPKADVVSFTVYNLLGRTVYTKEYYLSAGSHTISFQGSGLSSGTYIYELATTDYREQKMMTLFK